METIIHLVTQAVSYVGPFILLLGMLIFVHELGHFSVAKFFKVRVETFSLGFGKKILSYKRGDTTYALSIIPLGGYVKMYGDDPTQNIPEQEKKHSFLHKPVYQRILVVLAGPMMNFFFAIFLFAVIIGVGHQVTAPLLGDINATSVAYQAGFRSGDQVLAVNGKPVEMWDQIKKSIQDAGDTSATFKVRREGTAEEADVSTKVTWGANDDVFSLRRQVGVIEGLENLSLAPVVGWSDPQSAAAKAGFKPLDYIESINGEKITYFRQLETTLNKFATQGDLQIQVRELLPDGTTSKESRTVTVPKSAIRTGTPALQSMGLESTELYLASVKKDSPAEKAGLKVGDRIYAIDGKRITKWDDVLDFVKNYKTEFDPLAIEIRRQGQAQSIEVRPEMTEMMGRNLKDEQRFAIGIVPAITSVMAPPVIERRTNPLSALSYGLDQSIHWSKLVVISIVKLVQNEVSSRNIAGVITIGRVANQSFAVGFDAFLKIMAVISINLFLLNLLPVPILDGGHLVFYTIEAIRGAPLSMRKMEIAQQFGLILMMSLMAFALFNDIRNLFQSPW